MRQFIIYALILGAFWLLTISGITGRIGGHIATLWTYNPWYIKALLVFVAVNAVMLFLGLLYLITRLFSGRKKKRK